MPKFGRFTFADNAEVKRRAGSDWLKDHKGRWRKLRGWSSAAGEWMVTKGVWTAYYAATGGSHYVVSLPVHYVIAKKEDA